MILFLGIVTSYEDKKYGKIRNKWVILALIYSAFVNIFLYLLGYINFAHIGQLSINGLISLVFGFLIWRVNLWSAGDAKLFFVYSLLLPLELYRFNSSKLFPSGNILANTFIPAALLLIISMLTKTYREKTFPFLTNFFKFRGIGKLALFLFAFAWPVNSMLFFLGMNDTYIRFFLIFLLFSLFERINNSNTFSLLVILSAARILFDKEMFSKQSWTNFAYFLIIFVVLRFFLLNLSFNLFTKEVKIKDLKQGMIPAEMVLRKETFFRKIKLIGFFPAKIKNKNEKYLFKGRPEGLAQSDITRIAKFRLPFKTIKIYQTMGFASFIFLGVLLTIIFQGNLILSVKFLLSG